MSTATDNLSSLPKLSDIVQQEVSQSPTRLKHVETQIKNILPTKEGILLSW